MYLYGLRRHYYILHCARYTWRDDDNAGRSSCPTPAAYTLHANKLHISRPTTSCRFVSAYQPDDPLVCIIILVHDAMNIKKEPPSLLLLCAYRVGHFRMKCVYDGDLYPPLTRPYNPVLYCIILRRIVLKDFASMFVLKYIDSYICV